MSEPVTPNTADAAHEPCDKDGFLVLDNVEQHFDLGTHFFTRQSKGVVRAVDGISLSIRKGEILGIVGESGCGKTTLSRTIMQLLREAGEAAARQHVERTVRIGQPSAFSIKRVAIGARKAVI